MRRLLKVVARLVLVVSAITLFAARAEAVTLREIVELTRAGLSDEVLLALIEIDQRVFPVDPDTLKMLKDAGVSPAVIVAIVKSGRTPKPQPEPALLAETVPADQPPPQVVVVEKPVLDRARSRAGGSRRRARVRRRRPLARPSRRIPTLLPRQCSCHSDNLLLSMTDRRSEIDRTRAGRQNPCIGDSAASCVPTRGTRSKTIFRAS